MKIWKRFLALGLVTIITAMMFVGCGSSDISEGVAKMIILLQLMELP